MKKKLNHTFLLVAAITIGMTVLLFSFVFYQLLCEEVNASLRNDAIILESALEDTDGKWETVNSMKFDNLRVTIVNQEGTVV